MPISYLKELPDLKISQNKKIKSHVSKNKKRPVSNLKETPLPHLYLRGCKVTSGQKGMVEFHKRPHERLSKIVILSIFRLLSKILHLVTVWINI